MALKSVGQQNVIYQTTAPNTGMLGQLWMDTSVNPGVLNECISLSPLTYAPVTGGGGGGAPTTGSYVTISAEAGLSAERVLTAGTGISIVDGGPNTTITINATGSSGSSTPTYIIMGDGDPGEDAPVIPGATGLTGATGGTGSQGLQGIQGPPSDDPYVEEPMVIPGVKGDTGSQGIQGIQGIQGFGYQGPPGEDGYVDDPIMIPGPKGDTGATGSPGSGSGATTYIFVEADPIEPDPAPPGLTGATGATGPAGGGGGTVTEIEVDFGTKPVFDALFSVTDAAVSGTSKVTVVESGKPATSRVAGDAQWDAILSAANPTTGSFALYCTAQPGPVVGKRKLHYMVT
jgi:hypothetical protein